MDHLVLIDGHHLMYRAYYAIPRTMKNSKGEQTNVTFGVASMLITILKVEQPTHLLFCFDAGEQTFRHAENATYKDGRAETPDEFYVQIPRVFQLVETFGFQHLSDPKYEADDLLGVYSCAAEKAGMRTTIITGDRDAFQLATKHTRIAIPHKAYQQAEYLGPEEIEAKYGIRPDQVPAYKGLTGDASDNLPGVKGIGPKGAAELLQKYQTLQGIYDHLEEIKPATREKLEHDREQAFFCEHMAQLVCDLPLQVPLEKIAIESIQLSALLPLFHELQFSLLARRLEGMRSTPFGQKYLVAAEQETVKPKTENQLSLF